MRHPSLLLYLTSHTEQSRPPQNPSEADASHEQTPVVVLHVPWPLQLNRDVFIAVFVGHESTVGPLVAMNEINGVPDVARIELVILLLVLLSSFDNVTKHLTSVAVVVVVVETAW